MAQRFEKPLLKILIDLFELNFLLNPILAVGIIFACMTFHFGPFRIIDHFFLKKPSPNLSGYHSPRTP